uniref:Lipoyl-binding domain-containing protein n=1 Tax=Populus trichocarpa TaxID=3694 RepID=A0A3N7EMK9_POPTR
MLNFVTFPFLCLEVSFLLKHVLVKFHLQIESLVTEICNTTSIAEFELKVGFFRRSRTIKGKRAPPSCKEKQIIKEGQVLCYIEQLGGELPIESDISGEVIKILREDGEPVGYGDALIAILPSFPGIKKLQ